MRRVELDRLVGHELEMIPRGPKHSEQNAFRMIYNMIRRRELGRDPQAPASESLDMAIRAVRAGSPGFRPLLEAGG